MKDGVLDGPVESYWDNGQLRTKGTMKDGEKDGPWERYHENGKLRMKGTFKDGVRCGEWIEDGRTSRTVTYPPC